MRLILIVLTLFFIGKLEASFYYGNVHMMGGYPTFGVGIRNQKGCRALDFSVSSLPLTPVFHGRGLFLFYPKQQGFYVAAGLGCFNDPELFGFSGSYESALGYQWYTKSGRVMFLQLEAFGPLKKTKWGRTPWPGITYGVQF